MATTMRLLRLTTQHTHKAVMFRFTLASLPKQSSVVSFSTTRSENSGRKMVAGEEFWKKNDRMKRPMSPHVLIYSFPLPAVMSITNRITGGAWSALIAGVGCGALMYPGDSAALLSTIKALDIPIWAMAPIKFTLLWPFVYHTINGVRHLVWDFDRGLHLKEIYISGWIIFALSVLGTAGVVGYCTM